MPVKSANSIPLGVLCLSFLFPVHGQESSILLPEAPPRAEPPVVRAGLGAQSSSGTPEVYSIGDPTPEEQLYLEMINRSRANPQGEAQLFFQTTDPAVLHSYNNSRWIVNLTAMTNQFAQIQPAPPLAMNPRLLSAARKHSQDMFQNVFQGHTSNDGRTLADRVAVEGYPYERLSENVYAYAKSVFHGHAGFDVDWGPGTDGIQTPPGHRINIHNPLHREVGIGVVLGTNSDPLGQKPTVGPQLVTQNFGAQISAQPFITGVAYYDLNGNNFYDPGEGIGGLTVTAEGLSTAAITARSGGYALPVPTNGSYHLTFTGPNLSQTAYATVISNQNVKVDLRPGYPPPLVAGPGLPVANQSNSYSFTPVGGAVLHEWRQIHTRPAVANTASNTNEVTVQTSGSYDVVNTETFVSPGSSFRLVHLEPPQYQIITLKSSFLLSNQPLLAFQSRLGKATSDQFAEVQISTDEGRAWTTIYSQAGGTEETSFTLRSIPLGTYSGRTVRFRFVFRFDYGLYHPTTQSGVGWYLDDIHVQNAEEILGSSSAITEAGSFSFIPPAAGRFGLQVRGLTGHQFLEWGPALFVQAGLGPPQVQITSVEPLRGAIRLRFQLVSGTPPSGYAVEARANLSTPWALLKEIPAPEADSPSQIALELPISGQQQGFYRILPRP